MLPISRRTPRAFAALAAGLAATAMVSAALWLQSSSQTPKVMSVSELRQHTHIHGLAVDRGDPDYLLIATHHGMFRAGSDGFAELVSPVMDFMGFSPHPDDPGTFSGSSPRPCGPMRV